MLKRIFGSLDCVETVKSCLLAYDFLVTCSLMLAMHSRLLEFIHDLNLQ